MSNPEYNDQEMPLIAHLTELRSRLLRCIIVVFLLFLALFPFSQELYALVAAPVRELLPAGSTMIATGLPSTFFAPLKLISYLAIFIAVPYLLYQVWSFIAPGLYKHEKRIAVPVLISSILLFYIGMAFAYFVVFPIMVAFLTSVSPEGVVVMPEISQYLDLVLALFFAFGFAFEVPVATFLLIFVGIVDAAAVSKARPYVIVGCFIVGMLLTPPDVLSQILLAVPMWVLFEIGLVLGRIMTKRAAESTSTDLVE